MNNISNDVYRELDLPRYVISLYEALPDTPETSEAIRRYTKLPRASVVAGLSQLNEVGLVKRKPLNKKSYTYTKVGLRGTIPYIAAKNRRLSEMIEMIPGSAAHTDDFDITLATTESEIIQLFDRALYCSSRTWYIASPQENILTTLPEPYQKSFKKIRKERQIQSYSIWNSRPPTKSLSLLDRFMRQPRQINIDYDRELKSLCLAFDDYVLFASHNQAVLIQNASLAGTIKAIFKLGYDSLDPLRN